MRMKRNEFWNPRGNRGDSFEGDWIAEGAVEIENPSHHAWLEGGSPRSPPVEPAGPIDRSSPLRPIGRRGPPPEAEVTPGVILYVFPGFPAFLESASTELGHARVGEVLPVGSYR